MLTVMLTVNSRELEELLPEELTGYRVGRDTLLGYTQLHFWSPAPCDLPWLISSICGKVTMPPARLGLDSGPLCPDCLRVLRGGRLHDQQPLG